MYCREKKAELYFIKMHINYCPKNFMTFLQSFLYYTLRITHFVLNPCYKRTITNTYLQYRHNILYYYLAIIYVKISELEKDMEIYK